MKSEAPSLCPNCNSPLKRRRYCNGVRLVCENPACEVIEIRPHNRVVRKLEVLKIGDWRRLKHE